jgi:hypothetical protein
MFKVGDIVMLDIGNKRDTKYGLASVSPGDVGIVIEVGNNCVFVDFPTCRVRQADPSELRDPNIKLTEIMTEQEVRKLVATTKDLSSKVYHGEDIRFGWGSSVHLVGYDMECVYFKIVDKIYSYPRVLLAGFIYLDRIRETNKRFE